MEPKSVNHFHKQLKNLYKAQQENIVAARLSLWYQNSYRTDWLNVFSDFIFFCMILLIRKCNHGATFFKNVKFAKWNCDIHVKIIPIMWVHLNWKTDEWTQYFLNDHSCRYWLNKLIAIYFKNKLVVGWMNWLSIKVFFSIHFSHLMSHAWQHRLMSLTYKWWIQHLHR